jgi:c-di-GMP-binding flagellar brake protein YcgR
MSDSDNESPVAPFPVAPLNGEDLEQYLVRGFPSIRQLLQEIINARSLLSVHLLPGGLSFLSTIVTLSEDERWLFIDASQNEVIHRHSLEAERMLCITQLNKVRIQFRIGSVTEVPFNGHPALAAPIPDEILRLQRRDAFRLQVPLSHKLICVLPVQEHSRNGHKKILEAPVVDISAGGLSMEVPTVKTPPGVGDKINGCHLRLPGDIFIGISLEIRNHGRRIRADGKEVLRLGCSFIGLPAQSESQIQRYIYQAEREINALV